MKFIYVIVAVLLIFAGLFGFSVTSFHRNKAQLELVPYKQNYSRQEDELLARFARQSTLTPEEEYKLLKDSGRYGAEWKAEQKLRLKADLDELAAGDKQPGVYADLVYGENWQGHVEKHKAKKELSEMTVTASALSFLAGVVMLVLGCYRWLVRFISEGLNRRRLVKRKLAELLSRSRKAGKKYELKLVLAAQAGNVKEEDFERPDDEQINQ